MYNFRSLSDKFNTIFWSFDHFSHFTVQCKLFFVQPKIGEGNQKNSQFPNTLNFVYNFRRITACNPEALVISIVKDSGTKRGNKLFKLWKQRASHERREPRFSALQEDCEKGRRWLLCFPFGARFFANSADKSDEKAQSPFSSSPFTFRE